MIAALRRIVAGLILLWCCAGGVGVHAASRLEVRLFALSSDFEPQMISKPLVEADSSMAFVHQVVVEGAKVAAQDCFGKVASMLDSLRAAGHLAKPRYYWSNRIVAAECDDIAISILSRHPAVSSVLPLSFLVIPPEAEPLPDRDPNSLDAISDALNEIRAPLAWQLGLTGVGVLVSHFDTGVNAAHPGLTGKYRGNHGHPHSECWLDLVEPITGTPGDNDGHGTMTMGLQVGSAASDTVGVAWNAQFIAAAVAEGGSTILNALEAFDWVIDPDGNPATFDDVPRVLSHSWGFSGGMDICSQTLVPGIETALAAGISIVWAAGNDGPYTATILNPANLADTPTTGFAVGGWNGATDTVWSGSSRGPTPCSEDPILRVKPEVIAPAYGVRSTYLGTTYANNTGTSFAAPLAAGTLALMIEANPNLSSDSLLELLMFSSVDVDTPGLDNSCGYGLIDAPMACYAALTGLGWVRGSVMDPWGMPVTAEVQLVDHPHHTHTSFDGSFLMALPAYFPFTLRTIAASYDLDEQMLFVFPGDTLTLEIIMNPTPHGYLSGTVIDCRDHPAQGATVELLDTMEPIQYTDGNGRFIFALDPGFYSVACSSAVCDGAVVQNVEVDAGGITDIEVVLPVNPSFVCSNTDGFGYRLCDSNDPDGPSFGLTSISPSAGGKGTTHNLADDGYTTLALPFPVTYYGQTYNRVYLNANGIVTFTRPNQSYSNIQLPAATYPALYPFWDDLADNLGGHTLSDYDRVAGTYTLEWYNVPRHVVIPPPLDSVNVQVVIYDPALYPTTSGNTLIEFRYGATQMINSATIGVDRGASSHYVRYGYNGSWEAHAVPVQSQLAIRASHGDALAVQPSLSVSPENMFLTLDSDTLLDTSLVLQNNGDGALSYEIRAGSSAQPGFAADFPSVVPDVLERQKGEACRDESFFAAPLDDSAPDANGYSWGDSRQQGGPAYVFTDISTIGTNLNLTWDDTTSHPLALPWAFPFYDRLFDRVGICTNGFLSFWSQSYNYANELLTVQKDPYYMIAPFWMDLNPTAGSSRVCSYYDTVNDRFVIQWHRLPRWGGSPSNTYTFQVILYPTGRVDLVYQSMMDVLNLATTGLKGGDASETLVISHNSNYLASNVLIRITRPDTSDVSVSVLSGAAGVIPPFGSKEIALRIKAQSGLNSLTDLSLAISTSDPLAPSLSLPLQVSSGIPFEPQAVLQPFEGGLRLLWTSHPHARYRIKTAMYSDSTFTTYVSSTTDTFAIIPLPVESQRFYTVTLAP